MALMRRDSISGLGRLMAGDRVERRLAAIQVKMALPIISFAENFCGDFLRATFIG
jgi:hypothetical protein